MRVESLTDETLRRVGGHEDARQQFIDLPHHHERVETSERRHVHVEKHGVHKLGANDLDGLFARRRQDGLVPLRLDDIAQSLAARTVVVRDQD